MGEDYDKRHVHVATSYRNTSYGNTSSYRNISYANIGSYRSTSCGNTSSYSSCRFDRPTYHNNDNYEKLVEQATVALGPPWYLGSLLLLGTLRRPGVYDGRQEEEEENQGSTC